MTKRKGHWTADEDKKLRDAVPTHGTKDRDATATLVPSRTRIQCRNRWMRYVDSNRSTGREEEHHDTLNKAPNVERARPSPDMVGV